MGKKIKNRKNKQKQYFSGKKKRHTQKAQVVIDRKTELIICTSFTNGKKHDFNLYKKSNLNLKEETKLLVDSGYQGIEKLHRNTDTPKKNTKHNKLTKEDKKENKELSRKRIKVENVIGAIKIFKIISERYRNRRKRFGLRFNLIAGIWNFELSR